MSIVKQWPMTAFCVAYAAFGFLLIAAGVIDGTADNILRMVVAGFLVLFILALLVVFYYYLPSTRETGWRGLLPRHVVKVTVASSLTIGWVVVELWARTFETHYYPPISMVHAGLTAVLWLWSLSDVLGFEQKRVNLATGAVNMRNDAGHCANRRRGDA